MSAPVQIVFIVGPTAIGKSDIAIALAEEIDGEIVSCDSMQVYQEIKIASNSPSSHHLTQMPHHLIDIVSVEDDFDVAQFNRLANESIEKIVAQNKAAVVVGGSGLYMTVLLDGLFEGASKNSRLRKQLEMRADEEGNEGLYQELSKLDPVAVEKIHLHNTKRIIRALEVCLTQDQQFSKLQQERSGLWDKYVISIMGLNQDRQKLYERINNRVDEMFEEGIVEEVKALSQKNLSRTASYLIGVKEILGHFAGEYDLEQAKHLMKLNTRHFAKRQLTWFRKDKRIQWVDVGSKNLTDIINEILPILNK